MPVSASEIRELLRLIRGVESVDVQVAPDGTIESVQVQIAEGRSTARVIRDIESALMSGLGLRIDHKAIQVANGRRNGASARVSAQSLHDEINDAPDYPDSDVDRLRLRDVRCDRDGSGYCQVTVEIVQDARPLEATVREADTRRGRMLASARAAIEAVARTSSPGVALGLDGLEEFEIADEDALLAVLTVSQGRERRRFHGAALEHADPENAAARAVLDGLNRYWVARDNAAVSNTN
jgi:hypothetical protein